MQIGKQKYEEEKQTQTDVCVNIELMYNFNT